VALLQRFTRLRFVVGKKTPPSDRASISSKQSLQSTTPSRQPVERHGHLAALLSRRTNGLQTVCFIVRQTSSLKALRLAAEQTPRQIANTLVWTKMDTLQTACQTNQTSTKMDTLQMVSWPTGQTLTATATSQFAAQINCWHQRMA
jgi:hypothetical protein